MTTTASGLLPIPEPDGPTGLLALRTLASTRGDIMTTLQRVHGRLGDVFTMPLPGFRPIFLVGPEANRWVLVEQRRTLRWRSDGDPVTELFRRGLLTSDGEDHDRMRRIMMPPLHPRALGRYVDAMVHWTDVVSSRWTPGQVVPTLEEMRRIALLIVIGALFDVDAEDDLARLLRPVHRAIDYISPGPWVVWRNVPRPGYGPPLRRLDAWLYQVIRDRRARGSTGAQDMLGLLLEAEPEDDALVRDQLITMLIAGHDTSTATLAWTLGLLSRHPRVMDQVIAEIDRELGGAAPTLESAHRLELLDRVLSECLRLYPPIHLGQRIAPEDMAFRGFRIPAASKVVYSTFLTHRHPDWWPDPDRFDPDRFLPEQVKQRPDYVYLPFGGGARNCIGFAFARVEALVVLARLLQRYRITADRPTPLVMTMHATLEPRGGVPLRVAPRPAGALVTAPA